MKHRYLHKLTGKITNKNIFSFDIETYGDKNKFLCVGLYGYTPHGELIKRVFWDRDKFISFILDRKYFSKKWSWLVATNLGFDFFGVFKDTKYEKELKHIFSGSKLIIGKLRELIFLDTMNYTFFSVKKQGDFLGIPKLETPKYILESRKPTPREYKYIEKYCLRDCEISHAFMCFLQDSFLRLGAKTRYTIASTSMDLFKRKYLEYDLYQPSLYQINEMRKGYYGGRTEVFKRGLVSNLYYLDYNSHYPAQMCNEMPNPNTLKIQIKDCDISIIREYHGLSDVTIRTPKDLNIPFLPHRTDNKLLFPLGTWRAWYSHIELRKALKLGYEIRHIHKTYYYKQTDTYFKDFVLDLYSYRQELKLSSNPMELPVKISMNSLYGKFAQKPEKENIIHINNLTDDIMNNSEWYIIPDTDYVFYKNHIDKYPSFINPIFSLYITAYGRLKLYEDFERIGFKHIYYCDTDSIITDKNIPSSIELGELKLESFIESGILVKPKIYYIKNGDSYIYKFKGINTGLSGITKKDVFNSILNRRPIRQKKFIKFKTAVRSRKEHGNGLLTVNQIHEFEKSIDLEDNKRSWSQGFSPYELQQSLPRTIY